MRMNTELIRMFGVALEMNNSNGVNPTELNLEALKRGYIINPACCTLDVQEFIMNEEMDPNKTFYKDWADVTEKSRIDLFVDQCIHYFLSYGLEMDCVPNDGDRSAVPFYQNYKYIQPISENDLYDKCMDMLGTNVALKQNTVKVLVDFVCDYVKETDLPLFDIDLVANKEAVGMICSKLGILPNDPFQLLRHIMFVTTKKSTLIKDKDTIYRIRLSQTAFDFTTLTDKQIKALASIFYRFKPLFLAFRKDGWGGWNNSDSEFIKNIRTRFAYNRVVINKIRRMAEEYHKPMRVGFWEEILGKHYSLGFIQYALEGNNHTIAAPTNFKIVQLIQGINERLLVAGGRGKNLYIIRNGKTWTKETNVNVVDSRIFYWEDLKKMLENELVKRLSEKKCVVKFNKDMVLACPSSEKNFVGDIPFGSYFPMKANSFFGVYWKNDWGTRDFDLSFNILNGGKIGWNSSYYSMDNDIIFSGDITNAPNGASEVVLCQKDCPDGIINLNRYSGEDGSKFRFFFGTGNKNTKNWKRTGYMVDPNHIKVRTDCVSDTMQQSLGMTYNNRVYLMNLGVAGGRVSRGNDDIIEALQRKVDTYVDLKSILLRAGFEDYDKIDLTDPDNEGVEIELDLTDIKRDTLITLFS